MMILLIAAASVSADPIDACSAAMRGLGSVPAETILQACPEPPKRNIWTDAEGVGQCDGAISFARTAAKSAQGLPPVMATGLLREFDKQVAVCRKPVEKQPLPEDDCEKSPKLWC